MSLLVLFWATELFTIKCSSSTSIIYDIRRVLKGGEASVEEDTKTTKQLRITILSLGVLAVLCAIGQFSLLADGFTYVYGAFGSMFLPLSGWAPTSSA